MADGSGQNTRWPLAHQFAALVAALALLLGACSNPFDAAAGELPRGVVEIRRGEESLATFEVELALTPADQSKGLMNRRSLPEDAGMAFLFATPVRQSFHMLNTLIPLDIAFWDEDLEIVEILTMTPCESEPCEGYLPATEYTGALEVNAGALEKRGVRTGDRIELTEG